MEMRAGRGVGLGEGENGDRQNDEAFRQQCWELIAVCGQVEDRT